MQQRYVLANTSVNRRPSTKLSNDTKQRTYGHALAGQRPLIRFIRPIYDTLLKSSYEKDIQLNIHNEICGKSSRMPGPNCKITYKDLAKDSGYYEFAVQEDSDSMPEALVLVILVRRKAFSFPSSS